ncbi:MAG: hypothetical protein HY928_09150 [Elusimicrobia bacterium]|nr:hypothetical protein [Elusimicrobiota bacterium]
MAPLPLFLAGVLSGALLAAPAAAQIKVVPEVAAPVGGGGVAGANGASLTGAQTLSVPSLAAPNLSAPAASVLPQVQAAAPAVAAAALPAAAVPSAPAVAAAAATPAAAAAPTKGLEGLREKTAEMGELLGKEDGGAQAGVEAAGVAATVFDGGVRSESNGVSAEGAGLEGGAAARAPPTNDPVSALSRLQTALSAPERRQRVSGDAKFFQSALSAITGQLKGWKASPRSAQARTRNSVAALQQVQQSYKKALLQGGREFLSQAAQGAAPIKESEVITSGTSLESLLGILFSGGMEATNPYQGFSGESAHFWGAKGLEVGAGYGAQRGSHRNEPGVMLVINSVDKKNPVKVVMGETLSRRPVVGTDIVAAIVTDGENTVVLRAEALAALAASSSRWKDFVVSEARKGRLAPFTEWERTQTRFQP